MDEVAEEPPDFRIGILQAHAFIRPIVHLDQPLVRDDLTAGGQSRRFHRPDQRAGVRPLKTDAVFTKPAAGRFRLIDAVCIQRHIDPALQDTLPVAGGFPVADDIDFHASSASMAAW